MAQPVPIKFPPAEIAAVDALADEIGCPRATVARVGVRLVLDTRMHDLRRYVARLPAETRGRPRKTATRPETNGTGRTNSCDGTSDADAT